MPAQTTAEVLKSTEELLKRVKTEGITDASGRVLPMSATITTEAISPQASIQIPPPPALPGYAAAMAGGTAALAASAPTKDEIPAYLKKYLEAPAHVNQYEEYQKQLGVSGVPESQQKIKDWQAQLAGITAQATQARLTLEQQAGGKDVTTEFLGRQQQEISRQEAIQAIPLQAQIAAEQGNLELAQDRLNTAFKLKMEDEKNIYEYNKDLRDKVYDYLTAKEKTDMAKLQEEDDRKYAEKQTNIKYIQGLVNDAASNLDYATAGKLTQLLQNVDSPTIMQDAANLAATIKAKPAKPTPVPQPPKNEIIKSAIDNQLTTNNLIGRDKKVAWETYRDMLLTWVNNDGIEKEFYLNYPKNVWLDTNNQNEFNKSIGKTDETEPSWLNK